MKREGKRSEPKRREHKRLQSMIRTEALFLWKYGIVAMYIAFTLIYLGLLAALPQKARAIASVLLVFTDPAAMGLFFMGAVILLEKSQRIDSSLAVAPIKLEEYILAKILPLMFIGLVVGLVLFIFVRELSLLAMLGVALSSCLFSLVGLSIGANIQSLNAFTIVTVPFEIVLCLPPLLFLFKVIQSPLWLMHPGVSAIYLLMNHPQNAFFPQAFMALLSLIIWIIPSFIICKKKVYQSLISLKGAEL